MGNGAGSVIAHGPSGGGCGPNPNETDSIDYAPMSASIVLVPEAVLHVNNVSQELEGVGAQELPVHRADGNCKGFCILYRCMTLKFTSLPSSGDEQNQMRCASRMLVLSYFRFLGKDRRCSSRFTFFFFLRLLFMD